MNRLESAQTIGLDSKPSSVPATQPRDADLIMIPADTVQIGDNSGPPEELPALPTISAVEGPNEPDNKPFVYDGVRYPDGAINESEDLWHIVKGSSDMNA
jgi:hypothetical protein